MLPHDELYHYGTKGMRWGIRKSLTVRAKEHERRANSLEDLKKTYMTPAGRVRSGQSKRVKNLNYRAEEQRRKAQRLREKADPRLKKPKKTASEWMDDPHNVEKVSRVMTTVLKTALVAYYAKTLTDVFYPGGSSRLSRNVRMKAKKIADTPFRKIRNEKEIRAFSKYLKTMDHPDFMPPILK